MDYIVKDFNRDATWWEARGGYTEGKTYMVMAVLSKYECAHLRRELRQIDERQYSFHAVRGNHGICHEITFPVDGLYF